MEGASTQKAFTLLGDQPSIEGDDALGFAPIAERLAGLMLDSAKKTPFTVGIEGGWGQGKSSLMGRIQMELEKANDAEPGRKLVTPVRFNAWTAGDGDVLEGLVKSVLTELDESVLRKIAQKRKLISWARAISLLVVHWLGLGTIVDRVWTELDVDPKARNEMQGLLTQALKDWRDSNPELPEDHLLVIFIDDLDRCSPMNVFQVFEAMKLYLDAPGIAFVVGFDVGTVSDAVLEEKGFSDKQKSHHYLEKVIQIRYPIPATDYQHAERLMDVCMEASGTRHVFDQASRKLVIEQNLHNPRRIKRFINSFILEYRLVDWERLDTQTLIRVLILKFYFPEFAQLLYGAKDPIREFLDYVEVRDLLRQPAPLDGDEQQRVGEVFDGYDVPVPLPNADRKVDLDARTEALERLEREVPEPMPSLVENRKFARLISAIRAEIGHEDLQAELARMPATAPDLPELAELPDRQSDLGELDVLWITDDELGDSRHMLELGDRVGRVRLARDLEQARWQLSSHPPDVLISDVTRDGDSSAGLRDLRTIRDERLYDGRVLLFTARVTSARRAEAAELQAEITSAWRDLFSFLGRVAAERR